jgi:hypothetical protein
MYKLQKKLVLINSNPAITFRVVLIDRRFAKELTEQKKHFEVALKIMKNVKNNSPSGRYFFCIEII